MSDVEDGLKKGYKSKRTERQGGGANSYCRRSINAMMMIHQRRIPVPLYHIIRCSNTTNYMVSKALLMKATFKSTAVDTKVRFHLLPIKFYKKSVLAV